MTLLAQEEGSRAEVLARLRTALPPSKRTALVLATLALAAGQGQDEKLRVVIRQEAERIGWKVSYVAGSVFCTFWVSVRGGYAVYRRGRSGRLVRLSGLRARAAAQHGEPRNMSVADHWRVILENP